LDCGTLDGSVRLSRIGRPMRGFDLCVDLVVSSDYLFDMDVFTKNADDSLDIDSEEDVVRFFCIRLVHSALGELDNEQLDDSK